MSRIPQMFLFPIVAATLGVAQERANQDIFKIQDFEKRIADYMKVRKDALAGGPGLKPTESAVVINEHERMVAEAIRRARPQAKQGDIFTPEISSEFRRLINVATKGSSATRIETSLKHAEPVIGKLRVNDTYPTNVPLQSTPPTLLLNLPMIPKELEYRVVGHDLVLRDVEGNLIVDFMTGVIP